MTADDLTALEKLLAAANQEEWTAFESQVYCGPELYDRVVVRCHTMANADCIAALHNSAPELIRLARIGMAAVDEERARFAWLELAESHFPNRNDEVIAAEGTLWRAKDNREALARKLAAEKEQGK